MKLLENEKNLLKLVRLEAILPVLLLSIIMTCFFIHEKNQEFNTQIEDLKKIYIEEHKQEVKDEVEKVVEDIQTEINNSDKNLKEQIKQRVYEAHKIATNIYNNEKKYSKTKNIDEEHILENIKQVLGAMTYNDGRGYFFIDDSNGIKILQPIHKEFEGMDFSDFEDVNKYKFVKKIIETIKNRSESYDEYYWYKNDDNINVYKKISFYKYFAPFNFAIGTGEYIDEFQNELKKSILKDVNKIKFGKNGYVFIFDKDGTYLSHFVKENLGKNGLLTQDVNKNYFVKDIIEFAQKNDEGFFSYIAATKPTAELKSTDKISYIKYFKEWDWVIGAGFYLDELNKQIVEKEKYLRDNYQSTIKNILMISIILTIVMLIISSYTAQIIYKKFDSYRKNIESETIKTFEKEKLLIQQSKMAMMGEMISSIAHQWKQPLSMISTAISGIKMNKEFGILTDELFNDGSKAIQDSVKYMSHTIDDFRDFLNPNKTKTKFSIDEVINKTLNLISSQFRNNSIEIVKNINEFELYGYENELLQVLINLFKNAKDEFVKTNDSNRKLIFIDTYKDEKYSFIVIKDNAGGIDNSIVNKIFEPYFTTKKEQKGTGIGLYMSRQIIEGMEGKLEVKNANYEFENDSYSGAEFIIKLPHSHS